MLPRDIHTFLLPFYVLFLCAVCIFFKEFCERLVLFTVYFFPFHMPHKYFFSYCVCFWHVNESVTWMCPWRWLEIFVRVFEFSKGHHSPQERNKNEENNVYSKFLFISSKKSMKWRKFNHYRLFLILSSFLIRTRAKSKLKSWQVISNGILFKHSLIRTKISREGEWTSLWIAISSFLNVGCRRYSFAKKVHNTHIKFKRN